MSYFKYRGPLPPASPLFQGRQQELNKIKSLCQNELSSYLTIFGGRQTGKTSLLYRVPNFLGDQFLTCRIDLQEFSKASSEDIYGYIAKVLSNLVIPKQYPSTKLDSIQLSEFLLQVANQLHHDKLVLLFDELGNLPTNTAKSLANLLRSWFTRRFDRGYQGFGRIMIILAGGVELYHLAAVEVSPFNNISEAIYLPDLTESEVNKLISDGLSYLSISPSLSDELSEAIFELVGGHPYLTQRIGGEIELLSQTQLPQAKEILTIGYKIIIDGDPLLQHLRHSLNRLQLWEAIPLLLSGTIRFSRQDEEMALLELLGLAIDRKGFWTVRNALFAQILTEWLSEQHKYAKPFAEKDKIALRDEIISQYSLEQVRTLCEDCGVDYEETGQTAKQPLVRELIRELERRGELAKLAEKVRHR